MNNPVKKIGSALIDQGAFSLANFLINIQLARLLSPNEYGLFALAFTTFTLVNIALSSFLIEPMMVNGSGTYSKRLPQYLGILIKDFWIILTPICSVCVLLIGILYQNYRLLTLIMVLALGVGPLYFQFLIRRICYLHHRPWIAAAGGVTYLSLILVLISLGGHFGYLSSLTGLGVMILSSIFGTVTMVALLRPSIEKSETERAQVFTKEVRSKHLAYGRWAVVTATLVWIPGNIYTLLLPFFWGYEATASLRAVFNLILPVLQIQMAMTPLLLPWLVRQIEKPSLLPNLRKVAVVLILFPTLWTLVLALFGEQLLEFAYDGKYQESQLTLTLLGVTTMIAALTLTLSAAIKAHSKPKLLVLGYSCSTLLCLVVGLPLMIWYGTLGVVIGMIVATSANLVILFFQFTRFVKKGKKSI